MKGYKNKRSKNDLIPIHCASSTKGEGVGPAPMLQGAVTTMKLRIAAALICAGLSACAGRTPAPVAVVQEHDRLADCQAITAEIQSNTGQMSKLGSEEGAKVAQNVVMGAAGLFIPVLWFGMDFQDAAGKEGKALQQRNSYLARLAETRCAPPAR